MYIADIAGLLYYIYIVSNLEKSDAATYIDIYSNNYSPSKIYIYIYMCVYYV